MMKALTAIFAIGSLFSATLANPVIKEDTAVFQSEAEGGVAARQAVPGLPSLPAIDIPTNPADLVPSIQTALQRVISIAAITVPGLPVAPGLPALPPLPSPGFPLPSLPGPSSPTDIVNQLAGIQSLITTVTSILNNLPFGTSLDQLKKALAIASQIEVLLTPIITRIRELGQGGLIALPGNIISGVESGLAALLNIINFISFLLGPITGILPGLGGS